MEACKEAEELAHSVAFNMLLGVMVIVSALAIIAECRVIRKANTGMLVHQNTQILITVHQLWLIIHCASRIFAHVYVLIAYRKSHVSSCGYMMTLTECFMMRTLITLTLFLNASSIPALVIERAIATHFSSKYEKFGKNVAVILILAQVIVGIGTFLFVISSGKLFGKEKVVYCSTANVNNALRSTLVLGFYVTIDIISAAVFPILLIANKRSRRNKTQADLSHRYQIQENIASIQTLLPLVIFQSLFLIVFIGALFVYFVADFDWSQKAFAIYLESVQLTPFYALILPVAIIQTQKRVERRTRQNLQTAMNFTTTEAAEHYFTIFRGPAQRKV